MGSIRLAASGIILCENKLLLARYKIPHGGTFLVGPGGGLEPDEDFEQGLIREVHEETGLTVRTTKLLFVEDLLTPKYRMLKMWFLCTIIDGKLCKTVGAETEGIIDIDWYNEEQLKHEVVHPSVIMNYDWSDLEKNSFQTRYVPMQKAEF